jgi:fluoroquinolone transport system permease protein
MQVLATAKNLAKTDLKLIARDNFLLLMFSFLIIISLVLRFALPALNTHLEINNIMPGPSIAEPLSTYYPLLIGYLIVFQGMLLAGAVYGFLILDEKQDQTLLAIRVTPIKMSNFVGFRLAVPALLSFVAFFAMMATTGMHIPPFPHAIAIAFAACLTSPITALFYALFAQNKLQGFGMAKFTAVAGWTILIGWFLPAPYDWLMGIFPPYFVTKAYWMLLENDPNWIMSLAAGIITQLALIWLMVKRFNTQLAR